MLIFSIYRCHQFQMRFMIWPWMQTVDSVEIPQCFHCCSNYDWYCAVNVFPGAIDDSGVNFRDNCNLHPQCFVLYYIFLGFSVTFSSIQYRSLFLPFSTDALNFNQYGLGGPTCRRELTVNEKAWHSKGPLSRVSSPIGWTAPLILCNHFSRP